MAEPLGDDELERLLLDTRAMVETLRTERSLPGATAAEGIGNASDDRVRVTARAGRIDSITLDPRLLRLSPEEFGDVVREAVNASFDDLRGKSVPVDGAPDLAAIAEALREVQNEGLRQMAVTTQRIEGAMAQIRERTHISGDPSPQALEHLLSQTQRNLDDVVASSTSAEEARGEGESARGQIRAAAVIGRLESLTVGRQAMRMASHELAEQIRTAVNAALEDLRSTTRGPGPTSGVDTAELSAQVREIQDMSLAHMRTYSRALRDIMSSIEGPE